MSTAAAIHYDPVLHVVLHQPEIPYNTGSVGRTCLAVEAKLWLVRPLGFQINDYYLRRAGLDYWEHLQCEVVDDWPALVARTAPRRMWFFSSHAARDYTEVVYRRDDVLVFGCESRGLPESLLAEHRDQTLRIPVSRRIRSLNLSNAVAVALYEAQRQWRD